MHPLVAIIKMDRPPILPGGILTYALGAAMGYAHAGEFDGRGAATGLPVTVVANLVAHYTDEYADVDSAALARRTQFTGGSGVLPSGAVPPRWALRIAVGLAAVTVGLSTLAIVAGILPWHVGWIIGLGLLGG